VHVWLNEWVFDGYSSNLIKSSVCLEQLEDYNRSYENYVGKRWMNYDILNGIKNGMQMKLDMQGRKLLSWK